MKKEIHWELTSPPLSEDVIRGAELLLGVKFSTDYFECLKDNHGAQPLECEYQLETPDGEMWGSFGMLLTVSPYAVENVFSSLPYVGAIRDVIPIVADGGGNYICLDYRDDETRIKPKIVYYDHEVEIEDNFFYLCDSFSELLESLYLPEDVKEDRGL